MPLEWGSSGSIPQLYLRQALLELLTPWMMLPYTKNTYCASNLFGMSL
jgi:hypothetical protein